MPGFHIHLAIANRYMEKYEVKNKEDFLCGAIAPDFEEKAKSHYTIPTINGNLEKYLQNKVSIEKFLEENNVDTDYKKGILLHLLTDKLFFTQFFSKEYIESVQHSEFIRDLYTSYGKTNSYIEKKYNVKFPKKFEERIKQDIIKSKKEKKIDINTGNLILPIDKLEKFIEYVSSINIDEYIKEHKNCNTNKNAK